MLRFVGVRCGEARSGIVWRGEAVKASSGGDGRGHARSVTFGLVLFRSGVAGEVSYG